MFSLSAKARYGLQATYDLALNQGSRLRQIREVAEDQAIPQQFLEQVLVQLKRARLVKSYRGSHGGYALARDATKITVLDVLTCLEGPIEIGAVNYKDEILANLLESCKKQIREQNARSGCLRCRVSMPTIQLSGQATRFQR